MKLHHLTISFIVLLSLALSACDNNNSEVSKPTESASIAIPALAQTVVKKETPPPIIPITDKDALELDWDVLAPESPELDKAINQYNTSDLDDSDPRAKVLLKKIKAIQSHAPVVHDYDGQTVKIPGFVVPLETDAKNISEFLLVPYYGACIHVPPPPINQTIYVVTDKDKPYEGALFDTVWVTGTINVEKISNDLGDAGYRIEANKVEPYQ